MINRISLDEQYMAMAQIVKLRGTCSRRKVGAVIAVNGRVVSTGYNGSPSGSPHCEDVGCLMQEHHCIRTIHSETNAILNAAKAGQMLEGATIYTTSYPCHRCLSMLRCAGINRIVYKEAYEYSNSEKVLYGELFDKFTWVKL